MLKVGPETRIDNIIQRYPFLIDCITKHSSDLADLAQQIRRAKVKTAAFIAGISAETLAREMRAEVKARTGDTIEVLSSDN